MAAQTGSDVTAQNNEDRMLSMEQEQDVTDETGHPATKRTASEDAAAYGKDKRNKKKKKDINLDEIPPPPPGLCAYFLLKKNRYCRFKPNKDKKYCVEHLYALGETDGRRRVSCPINPKHTCFEDNLEKHLKKCNSREDNLPSYHVKNINAGIEEDDSMKPEDKVSCVKVPLEEVMNMVTKLEAIITEYNIKAPEEILFHEVLREEVEKETNGAAACKHLLQQASLIGHMNKAGLLHDDAVFVEFGAGKGALSHWVQLALRDCKNTQFLPVEKASVRYKKDSYHKGEDQGPSFERLRMDIEHLCLCKVPLIENTKTPVIGIGKHLCGGATDLALRCMVKAEEETNQTKDGASLVEGITLALCCHHRCEWPSYVGKQFFKQCGLGPREFYLLRSMTSWATCASTSGTKDKSLKEGDKPDQDGDKPHQDEDKPHQDRDKPPEDGANPTREAEKTAELAENQEKNTSSQTYNHFRYGSLTPERREHLGNLCKLLIDFGRTKYLEEHGFDTFLTSYCNKTISLENVALISTRKGCIKECNV